MESRTILRTAAAVVCFFFGGLAVSEEPFRDWSPKPAPGEVEREVIEYTYRSLMATKEDDVFLELWKKHFAAALERDQAGHLRYLLRKLRSRKLGYDLNSDLHIAAREGRERAIRVLREFGADCDSRYGEDGYTVLMSAVAAGQVLSVRALLADCKNCKACDQKLREMRLATPEPSPGRVARAETPLLTAYGMAVRARNVPIIREFSAKQINPSYATIGDRDAVEELAMTRSHEAIEEFFGTASENARKYRNHSGQNLLHLAVANKDIELARFALKKGVWLHSKDAAGFTPFEFAVLRSETAIAEIMLKEDPSLINRVGASGRTPIALTIDQANEKAFEWVLKKRPNPDVGSILSGTGIGWRTQQIDGSWREITAAQGPLSQIQRYLEQKGRVDPQIVKSLEQMRDKFKEYLADLDSGRISKKFKMPRETESISFSELALAYDEIKKGKGKAVWKRLGGKNSAKTLVTEEPVVWSLLDFAILDGNAKLVEKWLKQDFHTTMENAGITNPRFFIGSSLSHEMEKVLQNAGIDPSRASARQRQVELNARVEEILTNNDIKDEAVEWLLARSETTGVATAVFIAGLSDGNEQWIKKGIEAGVDLSLLRTTDIAPSRSYHFETECPYEKDKCDPAFLKKIAALISADKNASEMLYRPVHDWLPALTAENAPAACDLLWTEIENGDYQGLELWHESKRMNPALCRDSKRANQTLKKLVEAFYQSGALPATAPIWDFAYRASLLSPLGVDYEKSVFHGESKTAAEFMKLCSSTGKKAPLVCRLPAHRKEEREKITNTYRAALSLLEEARAKQLVHERSTRDCGTARKNFNKEYRDEKKMVESFLKKVFEPILKQQRKADHRKIIKHLLDSKNDKQCRENFSKLKGNLTHPFSQVGNHRLCFEEYTASSRYMCGQFAKANAKLPTYDLTRDELRACFNAGLYSDGFYSDTTLRIQTSYPVLDHVSLDFTFGVRGPVKPLEEQLEESLKRSLRNLSLDEPKYYFATWYPHCRAEEGATSRAESQTSGATPAF